jgi:alanyl-tRNA synthetase
MQTQDIRRQFLKYFKDRQHRVLPSSPVVPHDDPTLLFTNAGMNQFKDVFLGKSIRDYSRAATSQKCIRVGGKHNDLENVGHTSRHLTFFEMLGNFSFGDYFKEQAIQFAWEVATEVYGFEPEKIWPTVFRDDDEAFELWTKYVPAKRITRFGEKDNFWAMGETGPCGPCSELLYDRGPSYGTATCPSEDPGGERFLEFWNLVFMQYNKNAEGIMVPLPKPSIDTGAGLERVVGLKMGVDNVFETDVLRSLIAETENVSGVVYDPKNPQNSAAFHVIADHLRCLAFAIADGVQPSNVDRGYVLRKVLRRAVRYGRSLGMDEPFLAKVLPRLVSTMGQDYTEITKAEGRIAEILTSEEEAFMRTLRRGGNILNQIVENSKAHGKKISGDDAFKLKDTYGLPLDEIVLLAKDADLTVDMDRFQLLEKEAKERSRSVHKSTQQIASENVFASYASNHPATEFTGYRELESAAKVTAILINDAWVKEISEGDEGMIILDKTPFYAEMGGQIGDEGTIKSSESLFSVDDCQSPYKGVTVHLGKLERGKIRVGDLITASINAKRRQNIANNHTATHLLHWALHAVLGEHVKQAGSVVDAEHLRFDFSHHKALTPEELRKIEDLINDKIRENRPVDWYEMPYDEVQLRSDIKQFFGEKYTSVVRVIDIDYSKELCGGTHTTALGNIGLFCITKESSIAAGVRRIEAVTGKAAEAFMRESEEALNRIAGLLKTQPQKLMERVEKLLEENQRLTQEVKSAQKGKMEKVVATLLTRVEKDGDISMLIEELQLTPEELRLCVDEVAPKLPSAALILAAAGDDKCHFIARVSDDLVKRGIKANELIQTITPIIEGSGGGKPNSAQAAGKAKQKIAEALTAIREKIRSLR